MAGAMLSPRSLLLPLFRFSPVRSPLGLSHHRSDAITVASFVTPSATRCVNWNPSGTRLLVGLGGSCRGVRQKKDGAFMMLHAETLEVLYEGRDARHWLRDVK